MIAFGANSCGFDPCYRRLPHRRLMWEGSLCLFGRRHLTRYVYLSLSLMIACNRFPLQVMSTCCSNLSWAWELSSRPARKTMLAVISTQYQVAVVVAAMWANVLSPIFRSLLCLHFSVFVYFILVMIVSFSFLLSQYSGFWWEMQRSHKWLPVGSRLTMAVWYWAQSSIHTHTIGFRLICTVRHRHQKVIPHKKWLKKPQTDNCDPATAVFVISGQSLIITLFFVLFYSSRQVQVIPWNLADSNSVQHSSHKMDLSKTVFVGGLHGLTSAGTSCHQFRIGF